MASTTMQEIPNVEGESGFHATGAEKRELEELAKDISFRGSSALGPLPDRIPRGGDGFENAEHDYLGNTIVLKDASGKEIVAGDWKFRLPNGLELTYGQICGLAGDFYGTNKPVSDGKGFADQVARFGAAFDSLANQKTHTPAEAPKILALLKEEIDMVNKAMESGLDPWDAAYPQLPDINIKLEWETSGRPAPMLSYLDLAKINWDHFGQDARTTYNAGHRAAIDVALKGGNDNLVLAYAMNAFADHFLEDSFSAGHLRTPRRLLHGSVGNTADVCAKFMHDEDNAIGLNVENPRGEKFRAFGDKRLLSPGNQTGLNACQSALAVSAGEIYEAWLNKKVSPEFGAWKYAPTLASAADMAKQELKPLFLNGSGPPRRKDIRNRRDDTQTTDYYFWSTALDCKASGRWNYPQPKMD